MQPQRNRAEGRKLSNQMGFFCHMFMNRSVKEAAVSKKEKYKEAEDI